MGGRWFVGGGAGLVPGWLGTSSGTLTVCDNDTGAVEESVELLVGGYVDDRHGGVVVVVVR